MSEEKARALEPAEVAVLQAEALKHQAERDLFQAQAKIAEINAESSQLTLNGKQREEASELAKDTHHHVYVFDKEVTDSSVKECIRQLTTWVRQSGDEKCNIEIQVNSPGGSISAGLALFDYARTFQAQGHTINTAAYGVAASMGGVILQVGNERIMGENAILLLHQGQLGAIGNFAEVEDRVKLMELFHERILTIFEARAKPINAKTTKAFIKRNWDRKDWWMTAELARDLGFVDTIR
jgi:ATP-dependent Clp endopeptidase proteolytic subunit ClpP